MADILIVGGTGFVGAAVTRAALAAGHAVTLLNRGGRRIDGCRQLIADRDSSDDLAAALRGASFDVVVDANAYTGRQAGLLLSALQGVTRRVVVISSASVYGDGASQPPDEDQPIGGGSVWGGYGRGKTEVEDAYRAATQLGHCAIVRPPYIFGPGNSEDRETWFWSRQLSEAVTPLPGDGRTRAHFIHCDDVAAAILLLATDPRTGFEVFNVADGQSLSFSGLASMLARVAGVGDRQILVGAHGDGAPVRSWFPFRDHSCLTDPARILRETSWRPTMSLEARFNQTFLAYAPADLRMAYRPLKLERRLALLS